MHRIAGLWVLLILTTPVIDPLGLALACGVTCLLAMTAVTVEVLRRRPLRRPALGPVQRRRSEQASTPRDSQDDWTRKAA